MLPHMTLVSHTLHCWPLERRRGTQASGSAAPRSSVVLLLLLLLLLLLMLFLLLLLLLQLLLAVYLLLLLPLMISQHYYRHYRPRPRSATTTHRAASKTTPPPWPREPCWRVCVPTSAGRPFGLRRTHPVLELGFRFETPLPLCHYPLGPCLNRQLSPSSGTGEQGADTDPRWTNKRKYTGEGSMIRIRS